MSGETSLHHARLIGPGERQALLLVVPPLLVVVVSQTLFELVGYDLVALGAAVESAVRAAPPSVLEARLADMETRLIWALSSFVSLVAAVALTTVAVVILARSVSMRGLRLFVPISLALILLGMLSYYYAIQAETPIAGLFRFPYGNLEAARLDPDFLAVVRTVLITLNLFSMIAPLSAMMAACSTLAPPRDGGPGDVIFLGGQVRFLKSLAVLGSIYMVTGVLNMGIWLAWPAALIAADPVAAQVESLAGSISIYWGGCFTVLIASFYAPAMIVLRERAEAVLAASPTATGGLTPEKFLEDHGLSLSLGKQLPQIGAVLAPLLAGPLGSAIAGLAQAVPAPG